jgi:hypothetical protein
VDAPSDNLPVLATPKRVRQFEPDRARKSPKETLRKLKRYLLLLEDGVLFHAACKASGLTAKQVQEYRYNNPQFAEAEQHAKAEGVEKVEKKLHEAAMDGNLSAIETFLKANDERYRPQRNDAFHAVLVVPVTSANVLERIARLRDELERRDKDTPEIFRDTNPFLNPDIKPIDTDDVVIDAEVIDES